MKLLTTLLLASIALAPNAANAQATAKTTHARATHATTGAQADAHSCVKVGELSSKLPALPAGASCPKALYTINIPSVKLDYASPMENLDALRDMFGLDTSSITLAYVDIVAGTGPVIAPDKFDSVRYTGYLADGTEFDSSAKHGGEPLVMQYGKGGHIPGWDTGFDGMRVGGKRRLFIPFELAYGKNGHPPVIPAKANLIFDVELVTQSDTAPAPKAPPTPPVSATPPPVSATPPPSAAPASAPPAAKQPVTPVPATPETPATKPAMPPAAAQPAPAAKPQ